MSRVQNLGFNVQGLGLRVEGLRLVLRLSGFGFQVRVQVRVEAFGARPFGTCTGTMCLASTRACVLESENRMIDSLRGAAGSIHHQCDVNYFEIGRDR